MRTSLDVRLKTKRYIDVSPLSTEIKKLRLLSDERLFFAFFLYRG